MRYKITIACCTALIVSLFQPNLLFGQIFISKADTSYVYGFEAANITTNAIPLAKMFTFSDAFSHNNLTPTEIVTMRQPIQKLFIHKADAYMTNEFVSDEILTSVDKTIIKTFTPNTFSLSQNYPNPFNPTTTIKFDLPKRTFVTLKVYDVVCREVATLINEELQCGEYNIVFDAKGLASGVYFYHLVTDGYVQSRKILLLR